METTTAFHLAICFSCSSYPQEWDSWWLLPGAFVKRGHTWVSNVASGGAADMQLRSLLRHRGASWSTANDIGLVNRASVSRERKGEIPKGLMLDQDPRQGDGIPDSRLL